MGGTTLLAPMPPMLLVPLPVGPFLCGETEARAMLHPRGRGIPGQGEPRGWLGLCLLGGWNYTPGSSFAAHPRAQSLWRSVGCSSAAFFSEIRLLLGLQWTEAALGLLQRQGRSKGTEKYWLVKGVLGPAPQQQDARLHLLHMDSSAWLAFSAH